MMHTHHVHFYGTLKYDPIMKNKTTLIVAALTLAVCAPVSAQSGQATSRSDQANALYKTGISAMKEGKYDVATTSFREVLRLYPKHHLARRHLLNIQTNRNSLEASKRKAPLKTVVIPEVSLDDVTMQDALDALAILTKNASKEKVTPSFIVQDTTGAFDNSSITLSLTHIPADTVLKYIVDQGGGKVRYDKHAIVVSPRNPQRAKPSLKAAPSIDLEN